MAEFVINVTDDERLKCLNAVVELNNIQHIKKMSVAMIAQQSGINQNKCRAVIQDLLDSHMLAKWQATDNAKLQRYYYTVEAAGKAFIKSH